METTQLNWADLTILAIILVSTVIGLVRGFVREAFSLAVWVLAFWIGWTFFRDLAEELTPWIATPSVRLGVAFVGLVLLALLVGGIVNYLVIRLVQLTGLSGSDRFIGMLFGVARGMLVVTLLVLLAGLTPLPEDPWWHDSLLIPWFEELALWLKEAMPPEVADKFQFLSPPSHGALPPQSPNG